MTGGKLIEGADSIAKSKLIIDDTRVSQLQNYEVNVENTRWRIILDLLLSIIFSL